MKWKSIRDHFKKEVALEKKYRTGQASIRKKRKYIYYDQLLFLLTDEEKEVLSTVRIKEEIHTSPSRILEEDLELEEYDTVDYNISTAAVMKQEEPKASNKCTPQKLTSTTTGEDITIAQIQEVRYSTEDTMGNRDFLMSLLPLMNKLPDYAIVHLRLKIMELFQMFALPNSEQYASYQQQQQQQQYSYPTSTIVQTAPISSNNNPSTSTPISPVQNSGSPSGDNSDDSDVSDSSSDKS